METQNLLNDGAAQGRAITGSVSPDALFLSERSNVEHEAARLIGPIVRIPTIDEIVRRWSCIEKILERATRTTCCYEPIDLLIAAIHGKMCFWFVECDGVTAAVLVTEVKQYPRRRILEVPFIAGSGVEKWYRPLLAALDAHAHQFGCTHIAASGRKGWMKFGFEYGGDFLVRPLRKTS